MGSDVNAKRDDSFVIFETDNKTFQMKIQFDTITLKFFC